MRFRITVRGEGVELRGYIDSAVGDGSAALNRFAEHMKPNVVVASPAEDDYDPFKEAEHRELHHFEVEQENARLEAENARLQSNLDRERAEHASTLHTGQAYMQERDALQADHTESEKALIDQVNNQADMIEQLNATIGAIKAARSNHPECDKHKGDDPITCGWKAAVIDIDRALSNG